MRASSERRDPRRRRVSVDCSGGGRREASRRNSPGARRPAEARYTGVRLKPDTTYDSAGDDSVRQPVHGARGRGAVQEPLTPREIQVLELLAEGLPNKADCRAAGHQRPDREIPRRIDFGQAGRRQPDRCGAPRRASRADYVVRPVVHTSRLLTSRFEFMFGSGFDGLGASVSRLRFHGEREHEPRSQN